MSYRRPIGRSFSLNGRSSSENEEDAVVPPVRADSRNYLVNVRPEIRSTLCSVMAHLTEETQPLFETTLKSKAVSETSNVKFTCVISGYPAPELTWYKDDMEMDRYCGLPKYEIFHHGKTHSLHIYNCTEEDAAIYQASARNCKGIVSCSGVLEVGAMNEYRIHQRFFGKLKQKAEAKRRELEGSWQRWEENWPGVPSSERAQRKRRSPGEADPGVPPLPQKGGVAAAKGTMHPVVKAEMPNGFPGTAGVVDGKTQADVPKYAGKEEGSQVLWNVKDTFMGSPSKEPLAKKKIKTTNRTANENICWKTVQGSGPAKEPIEAGMSLSQYLAAESQQTLMSPVTGILAEQGTERREAEEGLAPVTEGSQAQAKGQEVRKEVEQHGIQSPLTSVFSTLRDIFFGGKKRNTEVAQDSSTLLGESGIPNSLVLPAADVLPDGKKVVSEQLSENGTWMESEETHLPTNVRMTPSTVQTVCPDELQAQGDLVPEGLTQGLMVMEEPAEILSENWTTLAQAKHKEANGTVSAGGEGITPDAILVPHLLQAWTVPDDPMQTDGHEAHAASEMEKAAEVMQESTQAGEWAVIHETEALKLITHGQSAFSEQPKSMPGYFNELAENCHATEESVKNDLEINHVTLDVLEKDNLHINVCTNGICETWRGAALTEDGKIETEIKATTNGISEQDTGYLMEMPISLQFKPTNDQDIEALQNEVKDSETQMKANHVSVSPVSPNLGLFVPEVPLEELSVIVPKVEFVMETINNIQSQKPNDENQSHLQTQESEVSELPKESHTVVENKPEITRQSENQGMENEKLLEKCNRDGVPVTDVSFKNLHLSSSTGFESNNASPPLLITPTKKITDTKDVFHNKLIHVSVTAPDQEKNPEEASVDSETVFEEEKPLFGELDLTSVKAPLLSPTTLRRLVSQRTGDPGTPDIPTVPAIQVEVISLESGEQSVTPPPILYGESSPKIRRRDSLSAIPSATPEELASGARRKIFTHKSKGEEPDGPAEPEAPRKKEQETPCRSPTQTRRASTLQTPAGQNTPPTERRSPLLNRRKSMLEVPKHHEETLRDTETDEKPVEKEKLNPFKAPQVIRKIRGEPFSDASGHLKLWCQFFNVLSDSTVKWYRDEVEIAEMKRSAGDERPVSLAIVHVTSRDCGVYGCSIKNEYGTDSTDCLISSDMLSQFFFREDLEVGEEVEMTPLLFAKGLADPGCWGAKLFGRIMSEESHVGEGCSRKTSRVKAIYGLEPVFESGRTCILKVRNPIIYSGQEESALTEKNMEITKQECKIQNMVREYCKIFAAEARTKESFGPALEVITVYLLYRPANMVPFATVEIDLKGTYMKYCQRDITGKLLMRTMSEAEQKCCAFQHWIHQWTSGNLLVTQLEGVDMKITNISVVTKSRGYQGLSEDGSPHVFEQFASLHQCNYYCGLLGLRTLRPMDPPQQPAKTKASRSPLLARKVGGSSSPQSQRKGSQSPQTAKKSTSSPKVVRKADTGESKASKQKTVETAKDM